MKLYNALAIAGPVLLCIAAQAQAQAPSKTQQDALRSNCRSDFMRHCASVTPGGREALDCLLQNKAKVSAGCQGALNAIAAPAAAKPEPRPEPKPEPAAATPSPAPSAPGHAAPTHAPTPAAPAHAAPAPAAKHPAAPKAAAPEPAPAPKVAAAPARPAAPAVPPAAAPAAVALPPSAETHPPRLGEAMLIRRFCTMDFKVLCKGVPLGQGRAIQCLAHNGAALSPGCRQAMVQTGELRP